MASEHVQRIVILNDTSVEVEALTGALEKSYLAGTPLRTPSDIALMGELPGSGCQSVL